MIKLILTFLLLPSLSEAQVRRAVMENTPTSNDTIFISTPTGRVGVKNNAPSYPLDVIGDIHSSGYIRGDGSQLSNIITSTAIGTYPISISGNAATVTNGVYTTGLYSNPAWLTSLSTSKVNLSTVTAALNDKLSNTTTVSPGLIDLSTVTTALNGKLSNTATVSPGLIDLSTVTTALNGKQPSGTYLTPSLTMDYGVDALTISRGATSILFQGILLNSPNGAGQTPERSPTIKFTPFGQKTWAIGSVYNGLYFTNATDGVGVSISDSGLVTAPSFSGDGSALTGIPGGDNFGNHIATKTVTAGYGISASTLTTSGRSDLASIVHIGGDMSIGVSLGVTGQGYFSSDLTSNGDVFANNLNGRLGSQTRIPFGEVSVSTLNGVGISISSNVYIVGYSSATKYYGDGSSLTGVAASGSGSGNVTFATDNLSPSCNGSNTAFTLAATPLTNSELITKNGIVLQRTTDYSLTGAALTMNTAPASGTLLYAGYAVSNASTSILSTTNTWTAGQTFTGANTFSNPVTFSSSVVIAANTYLGVDENRFFRFVHNSVPSFKFGANPDFPTTFAGIWGGAVTPVGGNYAFNIKNDGTENWVNGATHLYLTAANEYTNMPINIYNKNVIVGYNYTTTGAKALLDVNGGGYFASSVTVAASGLYVGGTTSGYGVSAHGVCIGTSAVTSTTNVTRTCTGLPSSLNATGVSMACVPDGTYSTAADVLQCIPNGTADQVTCHTSGANTTARTISCLWMKQ